MTYVSEPGRTAAFHARPDRGRCVAKLDETIIVAHASDVGIANCSAEGSIYVFSFLNAHIKNDIVFIT